MPPTLSDQNKLTLALLKDGDFSGAIRSSVSALKHQKDLIGNSRSNSSDEATSGGCTIDDHMVLLGDCETSKANGAPHSLIYLHPIPFPPTLSDSTAVSFILVFNAALAYHLAALSPTRNELVADQARVEGLRKAKQLYEQLLVVFCMQDVYFLKDNGLFHFAVTNNIATIYRDLGDTAASNRLFDYLIQYRLDKET